MAPPSRSNQFANLHKVLKKYYKPVSPDANRGVLQHYLFGCLLENAHFAVAEEALAALEEQFFDLNEIRVSSIRELAEVMARLPDPPAAANRVKRALQHIFEDSYSFDLEGLRKKNLGPATDAIRAIDGATPFGVAYVVQSALGGHAIPLDAGTLEVMRILDLATDKEIKEAAISGLERAIPKRKGVEFASMLHQLGADFTENPFAAELRDKLLAIDPKAKARLPKRQTRRRSESESPAQPPAPSEPPAPPEAKVEAPAAASSPPAPKAPRKIAKAAAGPTPPKAAKKPAASSKKKADKAPPGADAGRKKSGAAEPRKRKPR